MNARFRFLLGFTAVVNVLLVVFVSSMIVDLRREVNALQDVLATKQDLLAVSVPEMELPHERICTGCHTERRFAGGQNVRGSIEASLVHMRSLPDAGISDMNLDSIHASLSLLRCTSCHGDDYIRRLSLESPEKRMETIRSMIAKPDSRISPDEAETIYHAYETIVGF